MRIRLYVEQQYPRKVFTSQKTVRGLVSLELNSSTIISSLVLSLKGRLSTSLPKNYTSFTLAEDINDWACDYHKVFELSKVLFPSSDISITSGGCTLPKGPHSFPFAISFPLLSTCQRSQSLVRHLETALPPSFNSRASGRRGSAKIDYILKVKARRPGRFHRDISTQQELLFISSDPPLSSIPLGLEYGTTTSRILCLHDIVPPRQLTASAQHSAGQDPIILLEARLPSPAVLYAGDTVPLILLLHKFPAESDNAFSIELRSIAISLRSATTVTVGSDRTSWTSSRNLLQLTDLRRAVANSQERDVLSELNSSMLQDIIVPNITPSFTTCTVRHEHSLEVTAGFSLEKHVKSRLAKLVINVEIFSGVSRDLDATMSVAAASCEDGILDLIPLRPGCLEHLGISQGFGEDSPPPPYR